GYRFGSGSELPPLLLDDEEALVVSLSLRTAAAGNVVGMEEVALRALTKLEQVLPARLRRRLAALNAAIVPPTGRGPAVHARALAARDAPRRSPRARSPPAPPPAATTSGSASTTRDTTAARPGATSSRAASSTPARAGIWSRGISRAPIGARFASIASRPRSA